MKPRIIKLPKIEDHRGNLSVIEKEIIPFSFKRVYFLYDVPSGAHRGGHAHKVERSVIVALSGAFDVVLENDSGTETYTLNRPYEGLYVPTMHWRELKNFSSGAVCLVISSLEFDENDYIRDYEVFKSMIKK